MENPDPNIIALNLNIVGDNSLLGALAFHNKLESIMGATVYIDYKHTILTMCALTLQIADIYQLGAKKVVLIYSGKT